MRGRITVNDATERVTCAVGRAIYASGRDSNATERVNDATERVIRAVGRVIYATRRVNRARERVIRAREGDCGAMERVIRAMEGAFAPMERTIAAYQTRKAGPIAGKDAAQKGSARVLGQMPYVPFGIARIGGLRASSELSFLLV